MLITATEGRTIAQVEKRFDLGIPFRADETDLKAMIRSNPGLLLLHHGVVLKKWYYYDFPVGKEVKKYLISPAQ
ncbi:MAG: hypothetical protein IEMM0006_1455 [bacterium]|nr:MAG: hypothetical protein IEMM0006_1455 [bacterium]